MKKVLLFLFLWLTPMPLWSQDAGEARKALLEQAHAMGKAFIAKDYAGFLAFSPPDVVSRSGGMQKMLEETTESFTAFGQKGITFLEVKFGTPSDIVTVEGEMQAILPQMIVMQVPKGTLTAHSALVAISGNGGQNWYFIDISNREREIIKMLIPKLSDDLEIPPGKEPDFVPNETPNPKP